MAQVNYGNRPTLPDNPYMNRDPLEERFRREYMMPTGEEDREARDKRIAKALENKYKNQLKKKDEEIQLLKDENEFLNKRIEQLKEYGSLFKEYHGEN